MGFSIGNKGYIGTGYNDDTYVLKCDFWEYDPATNTWTQKADFGGVPRSSAVGFSIGSKGYIGMGEITSSPWYLKDFWEYNPTSNTWTRKADFGAASSHWPVGFSIQDKGYIGLGYDGTLRKDFWEYDPSSNTWTRKADFGGVGRELAVGFSIGGKGYVGTGGGVSWRDFWEYDPPGLPLNLSQGWNFISLPKTPPTADVGIATSDIASSLRIVWAYDNEHKAWRKWVPGGPSNTFATMEAGKGYWIYMNGAGSINMSGWGAPPSSVHLYDGWNLVGYSEAGSRTIPEALGSFSGKYRVIWNWSGGTWKGKIFGATLPAPFDELQSLEKEKAYWVLMAAGQTGDWNQDIAPPSVPGGLAATAASGSQINLSWNPSTDTFQVSGYKVFRGGTLLKTVAGTSTSDTGLMVNTQYCYNASAFDAVGNESAPSGMVCATTTFNDTPAISNLLFQPTQAKAYSGNVSVTGCVDFVDQGGNITTLWLQTPLNTISAPIQGASGLTSGTGCGIVVVSTNGPPGGYNFCVWVTDSNGYSSNTLCSQFTLTP